MKMLLFMRDYPAEIAFVLVMAIVHIALYPVAYFRLSRHVTCFLSTVFQDFHEQSDGDESIPIIDFDNDTQFGRTCKFCGKRFWK